MEASTATDAVNAPHPAAPEDDFFSEAGTDAPPAAAPAAAEAAAPAAAPAAETTPPAAAEDAAPKEKVPAPKRDYTIFQEIALSEANLTALLTEVKASDAGAVKVAYIPLTTVSASTTKTAAGIAYLKERDNLPKVAKLGVVTAKSFQTKTIKPKDNPEVLVDIS
jgi:hypothetical protein